MNMGVSLVLSVSSVLRIDRLYSVAEVCTLRLPEPSTFKALLLNGRVSRVLLQAQDMLAGLSALPCQY